VARFLGDGWTFSVSGALLYIEKFTETRTRRRWTLSSDLLLT